MRGPTGGSANTRRRGRRGDYFLVTPAGLTKESGYVSVYGEVYDVSAAFYQQTGDERFKTRAVGMFKARGHFRYPMVDENGYRSFRMVGPLDWRSHQGFPNEQAYGERGTRLSVAALTRDPTAIAYARQMLEDHQGAPFGSDLQAARLLEILLNEPDNGERLPMTEGSPDYAWADVDNGVVAIKRGEELTWIEPYWQSRNGLHSMARAFQITPTTARMATVRGDVRFDWNGTWVSKGPGVGWENTPLVTANGIVSQAYLGDKQLHAAAAHDRTTTREEFIGRSSFYATRYGRYLVGVNMDKTKSHVLRTPAGFVSAQELITQQILSGIITVPPLTAVVLDLGVPIGDNPVPDAPKYVDANSSDGGIRVLWETSGGAVSYTLKRATVREGPYSVLAAGLGASYPKKWGSWPSGTHLDTTAVNGTTYFYKVSAVNTAGESDDSPATTGHSRGSVPASVNTLIAPWKNVNFAVTGSASHSSGVFTLNSGNGDFYNTSDRGHFVYQPLIGDGTLVTRLTTVGGAYKTGIMIRSSLAANSPHILLFINSGSVQGHRRGSVGGSTSYFGTGVPADLPVWLRLQRQGRLITASWAADVSNSPGTWTAFGNILDLPLAPTAYIGLATAGGTPKFDNATLESVIDDTPSAPTAPSGLTSVPGNGSVTLSWLPVNGAASYSVRRSTSSSGNFETLTTNLSSLGFTDSGLTNGSPYFYIVVARNSLGDGPASAPLAAVPAAGPANLGVTVTGTEAVLTWDELAGAGGYTVRRSSDGVVWITRVTGLTATRFSDSGLASGGVYLYSITAEGTNGMSNVVTASASPSAPVLLDAAGKGTEVRLKWTTAAGATSYRVSRAESSEGPFTTVAADLTIPIFTDTGLVPGGEYFHVVNAVNSAGEGPASLPLKTGWGSGLLAQYFNNTAATGNPVAAAVDPYPINSNWGAGSPLPQVNNDNFSVLWTGQLEASETAIHTFEVANVDDVIRLWIDNIAVIDSTQGIRSGTIALTGGRKHDIRARFQENSGAAFVRINWSRPGRTAEALPVSRLYPGSLGANRATGGMAGAGSQSTNPNENAAAAFDGNANTKWITNGSTSAAWLRYQFGAGAAWPVVEYRITSANDVPNRDPKDWQFQGSNDGTGWTTLDTRSAETFTARFQTKSYPIGNTTPYAFYRLNITANAGGPGHAIQLAELGLFSPEAPPVPPSSLVATPGSGQATLGWAFAPGATAYRIKRSIHTGGPYTPVATVGGNGFVDSGLADGFTYHYVVSSVSGPLEGADSAQASATIGLAPLDADDLRGPPILVTGGNVSLTVLSTRPGRTYQLQRSYTLDGWENIGTARPGGGRLDFTDAPDPPDGRSFYRILIGE